MRLVVHGQPQGFPIRLREQAVILKRSQTWIMSWLYIGTFGSFIGYSAGMPLLLKTQFPQVSFSIAFLGPLVGSLSRPLGGLLSDRLGGARVTLATFAAMILAVASVIFFLSNRREPYAFGGFLAGFIVLLALTGIGNGSTFRMIPMIFRAIHLGPGGLSPDADAQAVRAAKRESAAALGFVGAIGAYGGWLIPQIYGISTSATGGPIAALIGFIGFYAACLALTWWHYVRQISVRDEKMPSLAEASV
jgi:MFS transporter, NNP family, nitrate/nitrite transporter